MPGDTTTSGNDADQTVGDNDGDNNNAGTTTGTTNNEMTQTTIQTQKFQMKNIHKQI